MSHRRTPPIPSPTIENVENGNSQLSDKPKIEPYVKLQKKMKSFYRRIQKQIKSISKKISWNIKDLVYAIFYVYFLFIIFSLVFIAIDRNRRIQTRVIEDSKQDKVVDDFYLNGNETAKINGTHYPNPSGAIEYELILPSYNISWPTSWGEEYRPNITEIFFKIHIGEAKPLVQARESLQDCPGISKKDEETRRWMMWCLKVVTSQPIEQPILVEYHPVTWSCLTSFNRTFVVENWNA